MKNAPRHCLFAAAVGLLLGGDALAQTKQTVEGAHQFLNSVPNRSTRYVPERVATFDGIPAMYNLWVRKTDNIDQSGNVNPCVTRITEMDYENAGVYAGGVRWTATTDGVAILRPLSEFPLPRYINWGKVSITRLANSMSDGSGKRELILATSGATDGYGLNVADPLMADRVEYAMRFLQASCDEAASTGF
ncbi:MAG: hypothetical protein ACN6RK_03460 [Stenotrophomonas sp.]